MGKNVKDQTRRADEDVDDDDDVEDQDDNTEDDDDEEDDDDNGDATGKKGESRQTKSATYSQEQVDAIVRRRLSREKRKIKSEIRGEIEQELSSKSGDKDLQKQLDTATSRIKELEPLEELLELAEERYEQDLAELPEAIQALAPDDDEDILVKQRWLVTKAIPAATKLRKSNADESKGGKEGGERRAKRGADHKDPPANRKKDESGDPLTKMKENLRKSPAYRRIL